MKPQSCLAIRMDLIECCHFIKLEPFFSIVGIEIVLIVVVLSQLCVCCALLYFVSCGCCYIVPLVWFCIFSVGP